MSETIVVGDIGSTKSSWRVSGTGSKEIRLSGFNPLVHPQEVGTIMLSSLSKEIQGISPDLIWYYGAGVVDDQVAQTIKNLLHQTFPLSKVNVNSDLVGAAIATCEKETGTVVILGTGSHAAVFDGKRIIRQANALGYILGDEAGGCDIGKSLLQAYFYDEMPEPVRAEMVRFLPDGRSGLLKQLYSSPTPNQYLATFAQVATDMKDNLWIRDLVKVRFRLFLKNHLLPLKPIEPVHFLGSIGCIFADLIENELAHNALKAGIFLKDPSYRLFTMHENHEIEE
jgi:glucosamine kinase